MEFTKEEKEILEKITGEKEDKEVCYRSFRVYRTVSLWKALAIAVCLIIGGVFFFLLSESDHNKFVVAAIIVFIIGPMIADGIISSKRNRIKDSIIKKYRNEIDQIMDRKKETGDGK